MAGVRGAISPFVGVALCIGWAPLTIPGTGLMVPGFWGLNEHIFLLTASLAVVATLGFFRLSGTVASPVGLGWADTNSRVENRAPKVDLKS